LVSVFCSENSREILLQKDAFDDEKNYANKELLKNGNSISLLKEVLDFLKPLKV